MMNRGDLRTADMDRLHRELQGLANAIVFPASTDMAQRVRERILQEAAAPRGSRRPAPAAVASLPLRLRFAGIAVAVLLAIVAALALAPNTRDALARIFGLKRVQIIYEEAVETVTPVRQPATPPATASPGPILTGATTLDDARRRAPFLVLLPSYPEDVGLPDEAYLQELGSTGDVQVILSYPAFTLYEFRSTGMFVKSVSAGTRLEEVDVNGTPGYWLEGALHLIEYRTADGREVVDFRRQVTGNTLAWEVGEITYRLETSLTLDEALRVAESLR